MRYFSLVDLKYVVLALFFGLLSLLIVYMAWGSYPLHRQKKSHEELEELRGHEIETGLSARENPLAPFLWFIYLGFVVWAIAYIVFAVRRGQPVGY